MNGWSFSSAGQHTGTIRRRQRGGRPVRLFCTALVSPGREWQGPPSRLFRPAPSMARACPRSMGTRWLSALLRERRMIRVPLKRERQMNVTHINERRMPTEQRCLPPNNSSRDTRATGANRFRKREHHVVCQKCGARLVLERQQRHCPNCPSVEQQRVLGQSCGIKGLLFRPTPLTASKPRKSLPGQYTLF